VNDVFLGRDRELVRLGALLDGSGEAGAALMLRGDPGIGKSRLLAAVVELAQTRGFLALRAQGVESQTTVAYTALHQILHPLLARLPTLPDRQATALRTLFGLADGPVPDPLLIRLGTLSLLEDAALRRPVLLAVEDVHWLDQPTADVLGFLCHRLTHAAIFVVGTARTDIDDLLRSFTVPEMEVTGLPAQAAAELLESTGTELAAASRRHILAASLGNPLALIELARAVAAGRVKIDAGAAERIPLTARLERVFGGQLHDLPPRSRQLLMLAAANDDEAPDALWQAAVLLGLTMDDLEPAERAGIVSVHGVAVAFRHPLVRSAAYSASSLAERTKAHLMLARAMPHDPDRAAWHRAAATLGRDDAVAAELEVSGDRYRARGALNAAMSAFERAARLSTTPEGCARLLGRAAHAAMQAGDRVTAGRVIAEAMKLAADPLVVAELVLPEYYLRITTDAPGRSIDELLHLARRITGHPQQGMVLAVAAMDAYTHIDRSGSRRRVEQEVLAVGLEPGDPVRVMALAVVAPEAHAAVLMPVVRAFAAQAAALGEPYAMMGLGGAAESLRMLPVAEACFAAAVETSRRAGSVADHCMALIRYAAVRVSAGALSEALEASEQALRLAVDLGLPSAGAGAAAVSARVHAWRGDASAVAASLALCTDLDGGAHHPSVLADMAWATALLALARTATATQSRRSSGSATTEPGPV
jgi:tetratricopeptide (TPR) repeat protein